MKKVLLFIVSVALISTLNAQKKMDSIQVGSELILGSASSSGFRFIHFPKKNFIIKRGAIANFNALKGKKVVIEEIVSQKEGTTKVILRRKNGQNFFRFWPSVTAHLEKALEQGELVLQKAKKTEAIAKN